MDRFASPARAVGNCEAGVPTAKGRGRSCGEEEIGRAWQQRDLDFVGQTGELWPGSCGRASDASWPDIRWGDTMHSRRSGKGTVVLREGDYTLGNAQTMPSPVLCLPCLHETTFLRRRSAEHLFQNNHRVSVQHHSVKLEDVENIHVSSGDREHSAVRHSSLDQVHFRLLVSVDE